MVYVCAQGGISPRGDGYASLDAVGELLYNGFTFYGTVLCDTRFARVLFHTCYVCSIPCVWGMRLGHGYNERRFSSYPAYQPRAGLALSGRQVWKIVACIPLSALYSLFFSMITIWLFGVKRIYGGGKKMSEFVSIYASASAFDSDSDSAFDNDEHAIADAIAIDEHDDAIDEHCEHDDEDDKQEDEDEDEQEHIVTREDFLNMALPEIRQTIAFSVSADEEAKAAGEHRDVSVEFVIKGWTGQDMLNALFSASSVRVRYQNMHRAKGVFPSVWEVPRVGTRGTGAITAMKALEALLGKAMAEKMVARHGSVDAARKALSTILDDIG